jgi:hypothetical protein
MRIALLVLGAVCLFPGLLEAQYTFKTYAAPKNGHDLVLTGSTMLAAWSGCITRGLSFLILGGGFFDRL